MKSKMSNKKTNIKLIKIGLELIMLIVILIYLVPVWMVLTNSLKQTYEANEFGFGFPSVFHFENYVTVFQSADIFRALKNGVFLACTVGAVSIVISSMASYFIARSKRRFARFSYGYFVSGIIIPIALVPTYFALLFMKLNNTYVGLILVFVAYTLPLSVFLYTGFIKTIPRDLDEAAITDGCGNLYMFFKVIFPLLAPVTATVGVFNFVGVWNSVSVYLFFASGDKWALPMTVYSFFGKYSQSWNLVFADIMITIIPCLLIYAFGQKYLISGMTAGAVKG